jgi:predicted dehydrogenase
MSFGDMTTMSNHPMWELVTCVMWTRATSRRCRKSGPNVKVYQDWREMLAKEADNIDSVNVSTPDHMHGSMGIAAMNLGKHLYGQKPLAHNLWECRQMVERAREKGVMTQMGIQVSSDFTERLAVELIQMGAIGKVKEAHTFSQQKWGDMETAPDHERSHPCGARLGQMARRRQ